MTVSRRAFLGLTVRADAYAALLAEEHAAIYLYGVLGPRLPKGLRDAARSAYDDHRRHRDLLADAIRRAGGVPPAPQAAYGLPRPASTQTQAHALAVTIEDSLALRWHAAVGTVPAADRAAVARALGDECAHLTTLRWYVAHGETGALVATAAFPGR